MSAERFRQSEDAYFKLRGQFDTGRITQEQFDEKLRELMVQDAQGRYWMLGADSGKWYVYDGLNWVRGDPLDGAAAMFVPPLQTPASPATAAPAPANTASIAPRPSAAPETRRGFPLAPLLIGVAIVALAIAAFLVFQNRDRLFVAQQPLAQITPILPPTITRAPSPTPFNAPTSAAVVPTNAAPIPITVAPTSAAPTAMPPTNELPTVAITIVVTSGPTAAPIIPTSLPTATIQPTSVPSATSTPPSPTVTIPPPTNTPLPSFPPDVYVTALSINPMPAKKNQNADFTATFLNTTGSPRNYDWLVLLYDPNKTGPNKGFGESTQMRATIPVGQSTHTLTHVPATGPGGCITLYARVGWKISAFEKPIFPNTGGDPVTVYFDVCPP